MHATDCPSLVYSMLPSGNMLIAQSPLHHFQQRNMYYRGTILFSVLFQYCILIKSRVILRLNEKLTVYTVVLWGSGRRDFSVIILPVLWETINWQPAIMSSTQSIHDHFSLTVGTSQVFLILQIWFLHAPVFTGMQVLHCPAGVVHVHVFALALLFPILILVQWEYFSHKLWHTDAAPQALRTQSRNKAVAPHRSYLSIKFSLAPTVNVNVH